MNDLALKPSSSVTGARAGASVRGQHTGAVRPSGASQAEERPASAVATHEQVKAAVEQIDSYLKASRRELQFQVDEESGRVIVRVRDATTGEVIRQIPGEEALRVARALQENGAVFLDVVA
ncbi:MAG: flagellar protein FlaG [Xanthomonadaceae bacterium]|nr:flagellar protein FlaG [Xanthomonadaceae bacterium]